MLRHIWGLCVIVVLAVGCGKSTSGGSQVTIDGDPPSNNVMDADLEDGQSVADVVEDEEGDEPDVPEADTTRETNRAPTAFVMPSQVEVLPGQDVLLDARGSSDPDGDALEFVWEQASGPEVVLEELVPGLVRFVAPEQGQVFMRIYVSDGVAEPSLVVAQVAVLEPEVVPILTNPLVVDFPEPLSFDGNIEVVGDVLWIVSRQGVATYDVSEPTSPVALGRWSSGAWNSSEQHIDVVGATVVVANGDGLWTFDANAPQAPNALDRLDLGDLDGVSVEGDVAYVLVNGGFVAVDVSNPAFLQPVEPGVAMGEDTFYGAIFKVHGGWLYGSSDDNGTVWGHHLEAQIEGVSALGYAYGGIKDMEARTSRLFVSTYRVPFYWGELGEESVSFEELNTGAGFPDVIDRGSGESPLTQSERLVWVAAGRSVVGVAPNEAPEPPEVRLALDVERHVRALAASEKAMFVLGDGTVTSHPISGDNDPALLGRNGSVYGLERFAGRFFGVRDGSLTVFEVDGNGALVARGVHDGPMPAASSDGGLLFAPDEEGQSASLWRLGPNDDAPVMRGALALEQRQWPLRHVSLSELRAVLIWADDRVEVLDLSELSEPVSMGFVSGLPEEGRVFQSAAWDLTSFIVVSNNDTYAIDTSTADLSVVASVDQNGGEVRVVDGRVLVGGGRTVRFVDWSELERPVLEPGSVSLAEFLRDLDWDGRRLAVVLSGSLGEGKTTVYEEDATGAWLLKERYEPHADANQVWLDGQRLYIDGGFGVVGGLRLEVYQRPTAPSLVPSLPREVEPGQEVVLEIEGITGDLFVGCEVVLGSCAVTAVDREEGIAQVVWTAPQEPGFSSIALVAGEQRSFEVFARAHVRVR